MPDTDIIARVLIGAWCAFMIVGWVLWGRGA